MGTNRFRVRKPVITAVVAASAIAATGLAVQQTAMASTNGQHIQLAGYVEHIDFHLVAQARPF